jgi:hypothetical protein
MELQSVVEKPTRIEAINKDAVHQICSGQVRSLVFVIHYIDASISPDILK